MAREPVPAAGDESRTPPQEEASRGGKRVVEPLTCGKDHLPMTPAERQRKRRAKILSDPEKAELLREADRLRKRRKRGGS